MPKCSRCKHVDLSRYGYCKDCKRVKYREWVAADPEKYRRRMANHELKRAYGITLTDYEEMEKMAGGVCNICHRPPFEGRAKRLHVDHNHVTGVIRGLLCGSCNIGLGNFGDNPDRLRAAAAYLEQFHD